MMNPRPSPSITWRGLLGVLGVLCCTGPLHATLQRVYMMGNSLTDDVLYDGFKNLVAEGGHTVTLGSQRIPGASITWLWANPTSGFTDTPYGYYPQALGGWVWDVLTLQPFSGYDSELLNARYFAQALRGAGTFGPGVPVTPGPGVPTGLSPDGQVYIYVQWPGNLLAGWNSDLWVSQSPTNRDTASYYEQMVNQLRTLEPETQFYMIPVGHVFHELNQLTRAGLVPGIVQQSDWMLDGIHLNDRGSYVAGLTFYAAIYKADPRGQRVVAPYQVTNDQAVVVQNAVWKVVSRHPLAGLASSLTITTPSLADGREGQPYTATLEAALASGAVQWSLLSGALPGGVTLGADGVLSGSPTAAGTYSFTIQAVDAGNFTAHRDFLFFVRSNDPPQITDSFLPAAAQGTPYQVVLRKTGGFGTLTWSITSGDLPLGMTLSSTGVLSGTPVSAPGRYPVTIRLADSIPDTATVPFLILVNPAEAGTVTAPPVATEPVLDGQLNESCWTLPLSAAVPWTGVSDNTVTFGVRWTSAAVFFAIRVLDDQVLSGGDAIHLFLDANHDREGAYNSDDRHLLIGPNGAWEELNGRPTGITVATAGLPNGYSAEVRVPFTNLERTPDSQSLTLGFDLAVEDQDVADGPVASIIWRATPPDHPTPATMGNLILAAGPVARNLLLNDSFSDINLNRPAYPAQATTDRAGVGWVANGVPSRPFASVDGTGYGFPDNAISCYGGSPGCCLYQVIADARATQGQGYLRFDLKYASGSIAYRLFAYNGDPATVNAHIGVASQQHPPLGGTPDATLLSGTLSSVTSTSQWREVAIPVDFGPGYDYLVFAFSGATTGINVDSRIDNVQLGPQDSERLATGPTLPAFVDTILETDLTGQDPALHLPWTQTRQLAGSLLYSGLAASAGITLVAGNDGLHYSNNHGSTRSTLAYVMQQGHYLKFSLSMADGHFDLNGGLFQFRVDRRGDGSTARRFAVFSSVGGFTEADALYTSGQIPSTGVQPVICALPDTAAYQDLTQVEFRIYAFDGQYAFKTMILKSVALGGTVHPPHPLDTAYNAWANARNWGDGDRTLTGDPNHNGLPNLLEFALDLPDPVGPTPASMLPFPQIDTATAGGPWLLYRHRRALQNGFNIVLLGSPDLAQWATQPTDGVNVISEVIDPNPDSDNSSELRQWRIRLSGPSQFWRLGIERTAN